MSFMSAVFLLMPLSARALALDCKNPQTSKEIVQCGACNSSTQDCSGDPEADAQTTLTKVVNWLSVIAGVIAVIMIIIAGFRYITSAGDTNRVASAKNTLLWAVVGIVIIALAQMLVKLVINQSSK
jgi:type IV secretory pathway VirB2 component (pilin)